MIRAGLVDALDTDALAMLACYWSAWRSGSEEAFPKWLALAGKFGLTPADRIKLAAPESTPIGISKRQR